MSKFKRGFSLVELLVVIAIIGILAAVGITAYSGYTANAKVKATQAQHASIMAVVVAEYAKCAGGSSALTYSWGDACNIANPTEGDMVILFNTTMGMKNPYKTDEGATTESVSKGAEGITAIKCTDGACAIITNINTDMTELTDTVKPY